MLNDYQQQFLAHLAAFPVRFLIVGGQARRVLFGTPTRDLDIWADYTGESGAALVRALAEWRERYPAHTNPLHCGPPALEPGRMIRIPDADVWYLRADGREAQIGPKDGVDILTSIEGCDFEESYLAALPAVLGGIEVRCLCEHDLGRSSKPFAHK